MDKGRWVRAYAPQEEFAILWDEGAEPVFPADTLATRESSDDKRLAYSKDRLLLLPWAANWIFSEGLKSRHKGVADMSFRLSKIFERSFDCITDIYPSHDEIRKDYDLAEICDALLSAAHLMEWAASHERGIFKRELLTVSYFSSRLGFERRPERNVFALSLRALTKNEGKDTTADLLKKARPNAAYHSRSSPSTSSKTPGKPQQSSLPSSSGDNPKRNRNNRGKKRGRGAPNDAPKSNTPSDGGVCYYCAEKGHKRSECPILAKVKALKKGKQ